MNRGLSHRGHRQRPLRTDIFAHVINNVRKLKADDVQRQVAILETAVREFSAGIDCPLHWRSLADTANMAETLSGMGICSGSEAVRVYMAAQKVLFDVITRWRTTASWTLYAAELDAFHWLVALHARQLAECDFGEFDRAITTTRNRVAAARAGNAPRGAIVVEGEIV